MVFSMGVPAAASEDDGHASLFFCEGVVVGGRRSGCVVERILRAEAKLRQTGKKRGYA
jgi:hypothetical protein